MKKSDVDKYMIICTAGFFLSIMLMFLTDAIGFSSLTIIWIIALVLFMVGAIVCWCIDDMSYSQFVRRYGGWD